MTSSDQVIKAIFLGAGYGERLRPITDATPKILIDVDGSPLLWHWAHEFRRAGIMEVLINTHHLDQVVRLAITNLNISAPPKWYEANEPTLLGSARTIGSNVSWIDGSDICFIVYGDNYPPPDLQAFAESHKAGGSDVTLSLSPTENPTSCGIVTIDEWMNVTSFVEKPSSPMSNLAFSGLIALNAPTWHDIAKMNARDIGSDVLPNLIGRMKAWVAPNAWFDIGTHASLQAARRHAEELRTKTATL